jgi:hypothetical protein
LAIEGADAFERGDYALAFERLSRAFALHPAPSISVMQARALVQLGRLVEALDRFEETRRMPLPEGAPEAYLVAIQDAQAEAEQLRTRIPRLFIRVKAPHLDAKELTVTLDGKPFPSALLEVDCPTDPGRHTLIVRAERRGVVTRTVEVVEQERLVIELELPEEKGKNVVQKRGVSGVETKPAVENSRKWWGVGALGGGAVALIGTIITGKSALDKKDYLDRVCDPGCPAGSQNDIDSFRTYRTISYASAGVSVALVGVGGYLLLVRDAPLGSPTALNVGPAGISVAGHF